MTKKNTHTYYTHTTDSQLTHAHVCTTSAYKLNTDCKTKTSIAGQYITLTLQMLNGKCNYFYTYYLQ